MTDVTSIFIDNDPNCSKLIQILKAIHYFQKIVKLQISNSNLKNIFENEILNVGGK